MAWVVTRDGIKTEEQLKDEDKAATPGATYLSDCHCGNILKFPLLPEQKIYKCPMCGMDWIW